MLLANTASLSAWSVAWEMWEWGRREGEVRSLVRESWSEAELVLGNTVSCFIFLLELDKLLDLSLSVFMQLDSSCLDK